jgi:hypothetical protein
VETVPQFAARIRTKYNAYQDVPDEELVNRFIAKYPAYKDRVQFEAPVATQTVTAPPPEKPGILGSIANEFRTQADQFIGAAKGAIDTATDIPRAVNAIPGVRGLQDAVLPDALTNLRDKATAGIESLVTPSNEAQERGKMVEQVGEYFAPAGKVAQLATKLTPKLGVKLATGAANAVSDAGVTALQTGGDLMASGLTGAGSGVISTLLTPKTKALTPLAQQAIDAGVDMPLTKAEAFKSSIKLKIENFLRQTAGGRDVYGGVEKAQNEAIAGAKAANVSAGSQTMEAVAARAEKAEAALVTRAQKLSNMVVGGLTRLRALGDYDAGKFLQETLGKVQEIEGEALGAVKKQVFEAVGDMPIPLEGLRRVASDILNEQFSTARKFPSVTGQESIRRAMSILEQFASGMKTDVLVPLNDLPDEAIGQLAREGRLAQAMKDGGIITEGAPTPLTIKDADWLRSRLYRMANKGEMDFGKGSVGAINKVLDETMYGVLRNIPEPTAYDRASDASSSLYFERERALANGDYGFAKELAAKMEAIESRVVSEGQSLGDMYRNASHEFHGKVDLIEKTILKDIAAKSDPEQVLDFILNHATESGKNLRQVLKPDQMQQVEGALWEKILRDASKEGVPVPQQMAKMADKLGPDGFESLFPGGKKFAEVQKFLAESQALQQANDSRSLWLKEASANASEAAKNATKARQAQLDALEKGLKAGRRTTYEGASRFGLGNITYAGAAALGGYGGAQSDLGPVGSAAATVMGLYLGPRVLARILAKPQGVQTLQKAMYTKPGTPEAIRLGAQVAWLAGSEPIRSSGY